MKIVKKADLEATRAAMIEKINTQAEQAAHQYITPTNLAQHMYRLKQQEVAKFIKYGAVANMPLLSEEAQLRGVELAQFVQDIEQRQYECDLALKEIELSRQQALITIKQAKTVLEIHQAANVKWPQLEDMREGSIEEEPAFDFIQSQPTNHKDTPVTDVKHGASIFHQ